MKRVVFIFFLSLLALTAQAATPRYKVKAVKEYPHDVEAYTQGLFFNGGRLFESTGLYGSSSFREVDLKTGQVLAKLKFGKKYFVEGSVVLGDKLYILTWTNRLAYVYDAATLKYIQAYSYPREGWGLTTDGHSLVASDGSSKLYFLGPDFKYERSIDVTLDGRSLRYLNELEWIDGKIWANVYTTDSIVVINPETGVVEEVLDCSGLLPEKLRKPSTDVLNGIAVRDGKIYLTGKNWPRIYEVVKVKK